MRSADAFAKGHWAYDKASEYAKKIIEVQFDFLKGMKNSIAEEKEATASGYFPLFHYNPQNREFKLDSKADFTKFDEFILGEDRYKQ